MSQHTPDYLNLPGPEFSGEGISSEAWSGPDGRRDRLCRAFECATGWKLRQNADSSELNAGIEARGRGESLAAAERGKSSSAAVLVPAVPHPPVPGTHAELLAGEINWLLRELDVARQTIWQREADLAAGVPVRRRVDEESHLATRLEAILKGGAEAVVCQAAGVYLLDEGTSELKLRACWGLPRNKLLDPARPLRGAVADLEALLGHAVVIEQTALLPHWKVPESYASAACVPIASPTEPLGTLWVFCNQPRDFTPPQTNLLEIIAGRIAAELQRDMLLTECTQSRAVDQQLSAAAAWQQARLPSLVPPVDGWQIAGLGTLGLGTLGLGTCGDYPGRMFHDWWVSSDGVVTLAAGGSRELSLGGALTAAELRGILYGAAAANRDSAGTLERVNELLHDATPRAHEASLGYVRLACESGETDFATAGDVAIWHSAGTACRCISRGSPPLGCGNTERLKSQHLMQRPGDSLILAAIDSRFIREPDSIGKLVSKSIRQDGRSLDEQVVSLKELLSVSIPDSDVSMVVLRRDPSS